MRIDRRDHASPAAATQRPAAAKRERETPPKPVDAFERARFRQFSPGGRYNAPYVVSELSDVQGALRATPAEVRVPDAAATYDPAFPFVTRVEGRTDVVAPALVVNVTFDGHPVTIAAPTDITRASFNNVLNALALMPPEAMREINAVHLSPHPDSAAPGILAAAGDTGVVYVFPVHERQSARSLAVSLVHESGHVWSQDDWGVNGNEAGWAPWIQARDADARAISTYGANDTRDDLAEAAALYLSTRGTPHHERYRALFPNRFAMLDAHYAE